MEIRWDNDSSVKSVKVMWWFYINVHSKAGSLASLDYLSTQNKKKEK